MKFTNENKLRTGNKIKMVKYNTTAQKQHINTSTYFKNL